MLTLINRLANLPILSIRDGHTIGTISRVLLNPKNLKIEGFYCTSRFQPGQLVLVGTHIRELSPQGVVVNDHNDLTDPEDLVRLHDIMELNFSLLGKPVVTTSKKHVGKVRDYAIDAESLFVQKLYVQPSIMKSFSVTEKIIGRSQIVELSPDRVVVRDTEVPASEVAAAGSFA